MKKMIYVFTVLILSSFYAFADSPDSLNKIINDIVNNNGGWTTKDSIGIDSVEILDKNNNLYILRVNHSYWQSFACVVNKNKKTWHRIPIDNMHIISAKFVKIDYLNKEIIEVIDSSNQGNGNINIMDLNLNTLLKANFYDSHAENRPVNGENISTFFRDNYALNIDYNYNGKNIIRIYGYKDYISERNNIKETINSEFIDTYYIYDKENNEFKIIKTMGIGIILLVKGIKKAKNSA
jgi:hypothetical protein